MKIEDFGITSFISQKTCDIISKAGKKFTFILVGSTRSD
jgi:hypothetical protein